MDLNLSGMGVIANGTAGINADEMQAQASPGVVAGHQVPEKNSGKLRMGVPRQGPGSDGLPGHNNRIVPIG
jgi:hypothetical protein